MWGVPGSPPGTQALDWQPRARLRAAPAAARSLSVDASAAGFRPVRYDIIGKERSMPERMPVGQREVTVLSLV